MAEWQQFKNNKRNEAFLYRICVVKVQPSRLRQIGIATTEPGDENNQDISALVGNIDIRKLEHQSQHDPDAYSYSGGLNYTTQGPLEFIEMFKAPIKVLRSLLTATLAGLATASYWWIMGFCRGDETGRALWANSPSR